MNDLLAIMRTLRSPEGCPWDQEQTHASLRPYLLEEAAEAVEAIGLQDDAAITEELGDVLLQIAFHAVIAEEEKRFSYKDIEAGIVAKLIRRHPHVFSTVEVKDAQEVVSNWQAIKAEEKGASVSTVPSGLPSLMRAYEWGRKQNWPKTDRAALAETLEHLDKENLGTLLLQIVDYARSQKLNPELALQDALNARIEQDDG